VSLSYREFPASGRLSRFVECFWTLEGRVAEGAGPERVLPDGRTEVIWNLADPFLRHRPGHLPHRQASALLVGQITGPILLEPSGRIQLVAARLRPAALGAMLGGAPAAEFTDVDCALGDVVGTRLQFVGERLADAVGKTGPEAWVATAARCLERDLGSRTVPDRRIAAATRAIAAAHGRIAIGELAAGVGLSRRQLERGFQREVGVGPKRLARIARFQRLMARLDAAVPPGGWAGIAIECGYFDQAHLIRDFGEFTGGPPGSFPSGSQVLTELFIPGA
jgi:methylphosphotriester-DNA--protein-cysteine methyltransferase